MADTFQNGEKWKKKNSNRMKPIRKENITKQKKKIKAICGREV